MIGKRIAIFFLFVVSVALASEPLHRITFGHGGEWSVTIEADGSAKLVYGSFDKVQAPPGSFDLMKIDTQLRSRETTNPGLEEGVKVYRTLRTDLGGNDFYYTENIDYLKELVEEVFEKSSIFAGNVERFQKWLERMPPLGVELYFDESQIVGRERYTGPPIRLRKPPPWFTTAAQRYPLLAKYPVVLELFSTPWPYVALLVLLGMVVRRWRLKRRGMAREPVS